MPHIQVLPAVETFGNKLAKALGGAFGDVAEGIKQRRAESKADALLKEFSGEQEDTGPSTGDANLPNAAITAQNQPATGAPPSSKKFKNLSPAKLIGVHKSIERAYGKGAADLFVDSHMKNQEMEQKERLKHEELDVRKEIAENKLGFEKTKVSEQAIDKSYEAQKSFIDDTTSSYKGFETEFKPRLLQLQQAPDKDLIGPGAASILEALHLPLGLLENPSNELYHKVSQDLLKGLPEAYGSRILKVEVENFLKTIPTLMNSPDGRRMIASNMLKLGEMKEVFYNEMRRQQKDNLSENKKFPKDFEQNVFDNVKPQIDRLNNEFLKLSEITSVPPNTIPFFNPQGEISFVPKNPQAIEWATKNGGKRVW